MVSFSCTRATGPGAHLALCFPRIVVEPSPNSAGWNRRVRIRGFARVGVDCLRTPENSSEGRGRGTVCVSSDGCWDPTVATRAVMADSSARRGNNVPRS